MSDRVIVTYAVKGREDYVSALKRLISSTDGNYNGDIIAVCPDNLAISSPNFKHFKNVPSFEHDGAPIICSSHKDLPYYFKSHLIKYASTLGYKKILWLDSTMFVMKNIDEMFESSASDGFMSTNNKDQPLVWWTGDKALEKLGIQKELWEDESIKQITACWMSFDLNNPKGVELLDEWWGFCKDRDIIHHEAQGVSARACYKDHRHDQCIMSWLMHKRGIEPLMYGDRFSYWAFRDENTVMANRGVDEP